MAVSQFHSPISQLKDQMHNFRLLLDMMIILNLEYQHGRKDHLPNDFEISIFQVTAGVLS